MISPRTGTYNLSGIFQSGKRISTKIPKSFRRLHQHQKHAHHQGDGSTRSCSVSDLTMKNFNGKVEQDSLDEIGKTFANRSGNVLRKFSSLLRRGNRKSKTLSHDSFDESGEP